MYEMFAYLYILPICIYSPYVAPGAIHLAKSAALIRLPNFTRCQIDTRSSEKVGKLIFQKCVCLVGKLFTYPVGVFCALLEPPKCHMRQKSDVQ